MRSRRSHGVGLGSSGLGRGEREVHGIRWFISTCSMDWPS